jgi:RNA polymerase sigma-70 factor (ECF subfamily)
MAEEPSRAAAFEDVVTAHHAEIHRYLCRMVLRGSEAEDLSQEAFLRAYRAWSTLPRDANVRAWLYTIATNVYRNHVRSEQRQRRAHETVKVTSQDVRADDPEFEAAAHEGRALAEAAIRGLPVKQRIAFTLRKLHDVEYEVIGRSLDCSAESARAHVFQALRKLRATLNGHVATAKGSSR